MHMKVVHMPDEGSSLGQRWLTPAQVCDLLQIKPDALRRMARKGVGPPFLLLTDHVRRYPADRLQVWMERRTAGPCEQEAA